MNFGGQNIFGILQRGGCYGCILERDYIDMFGNNFHGCRLAVGTATAECMRNISLSWENIYGKRGRGLRRLKSLMIPPCLYTFLPLVHPLISMVCFEIFNIPSHSCRTFLELELGL